MTQHSHSTIVPGCYRCDIGLDEYRDALIEQIREAAADFREADEALSEMEDEARRVGLSADDIRQAHGIWLR